MNHMLGEYQTNLSKMVDRVQQEVIQNAEEIKQARLNVSIQSSNQLTHSIMF